MAYRIDVYPDAQEQIQALPAEQLTELAEAMAMVSLTPWNGEPYHKDNPNAAMRQLLFGSRGLLIYLVLEDIQRVDILRVISMT